MPPDVSAYPNIDGYLLAVLLAEDPVMEHFFTGLALILIPQCHKLVKCDIGAGQFGHLGQQFESLGIPLCSVCRVV